MTTWWVAVLIALLFLPQALGGIIITNTSTPTLTVAAPVIRILTGGPVGCSTTANMNGTGSASAITPSGTDYLGCIVLSNADVTLRVFKVQYVSGVNESRLKDIQVKTGAVHHLRWKDGLLTVSETATWEIIPASSTAEFSFRARTDPGPVSTVQANILIARQNEPNVYARYPFSMTFAAS